MSDDGAPLLDAAEGPPAAGKRRRRRHRGHVEALPSGSVRVRVKNVRAPDGRHVPCTHTVTGGPSLEWRLSEARRVHLPRLEKMALDVEAGRWVPEAETTLAGFVEAQVKARKMPPFGARDRSTWRHARPLWSVPLAELDQARVASWVSWLRRREVRAAGGKRRQMASATVRSCYALVRRLLGMAVDAHVLSRLPFASLRPGVLPPESESRRGREAVHTAAELRALLDAARALDAEGLSDGTLALRLEFQGLLALRPIECAWAAIRELVEEDGARWLYVRRAKGSGAPTGEVDRLPLPADLWAALWKHLDALPPRARALGVLFPVRKPRAQWAVRWTESKDVGRRAADWMTSTECARLRERTGVHFRPMHLRHSRLTALFSGGSSEAQVQIFSRHKSRRILSGYAKNFAALPDAAFSSPFATPPGGTRRLVVLPGGASASRETRGTDAAPGNRAPARALRESSSELVGPDGRGTEVGPVPLAFDAEDIRAAMELVDRSRTWPTLEAFASSILADVGPGPVAELAPGLVELARTGALGDDGVRCAGVGTALLAALAARVRTRGPRRAPEESSKDTVDSSGKCNGFAG